jgi:hypothetical protein
LRTAHVPANARPARTQRLKRDRRHSLHERDHEVHRSGAETPVCHSAAPAECPRQGGNCLGENDLYGGADEHERGVDASKSKRIRQTDPRP